MTNFEKIKSMTIEEIAECIVDEFKIDCSKCESRYDYNACLTCIKHWLESEVEE